MIASKQFMISSSFRWADENGYSLWNVISRQGLCSYMRLQLHLMCLDRLSCGWLTARKSQQVFMCIKQQVYRKSQTHRQRAEWALCWVETAIERLAGRGVMRTISLIADAYNIHDFPKRTDECIHEYLLQQISRKTGNRVCAVEVREQSRSNWKHISISRNAILFSFILASQ